MQRRFTLAHEWGAMQVDLWIEWLKSTITAVEKETDATAPRLRVVGGGEGQA